LIPKADERVTRARLIAGVVYSRYTHAEGQGGMWDKMMSVMDSWLFIGGCLVALVVLIGVYLFLKNKNKDEE
jgi:hypothetical protein